MGYDMTNGKGDYFRLNIWGMGSVRRLLLKKGTTFDLGKFCSNDGWKVTPKECRVLMKDISKIELGETYQERDFENGNVIYKEVKLEKWLFDYIQKFKAFCEKSAGCGGFEVW